MVSVIVLYTAYLQGDGRGMGGGWGGGRRDLVSCEALIGGARHKQNEVLRIPQKLQEEALVLLCLGI